MEKVMLIGLACITIPLAVFLTGCSGEVYLGSRRTDEYQSTQRMVNQSWSCTLWGSNCGGAHGS